MSFKNEGVAVAEYEYNFAVDGGATGVKSLSSKANKALIPDGAVIKQVLIHVQTALVGSGASAKIGHTTSDLVYKANTAAAGYSIGSVTSYATPFAADTANERNVIMTVAGAALTAGKLKVLVEYILPNS